MAFVGADRRARGVDRVVVDLVDQLVGLDARSRANARLRRARARGRLRPPPWRRDRSRGRSRPGRHARVLVRARHQAVPRPLRHVRRPDHRVPTCRAAGLLECTRSARDHRAARPRSASSLMGAAGLRRRLSALAVPVLATTLYFTFSRGAWAALAIGLVGTVSLDPRRLRLVWYGLVGAVPAALCVAFASQQDALTTEDAPASAATREGHRLALIVVAAALASALLALGARAVAERVPVATAHAARLRSRPCGTRGSHGRRRARFGGRPSRGLGQARTSLRRGARHRCRSQRSAFQHLGKRAK